MRARADRNAGRRAGRRFKVCAQLTHCGALITYQTLDVFELSPDPEPTFARHSTTNVLNKGALGVCRCLTQELAGEVGKSKVRQEHAQRKHKSEARLAGLVKLFVWDRAIPRSRASDQWTLAPQPILKFTQTF